MYIVRIKKLENINVKQIKLNEMETFYNDNIVYKNSKISKYVNN